MFFFVPIRIKSVKQNSNVNIYDHVLNIAMYATKRMQTHKYKIKKYVIMQ